MPGVASLEAFQRAVNEFDISSYRLTIDPAALAAARQSLDQSGLLLLGEVHGVRQNPLLARALMVELNVTGLALEWPAGLATAVSGFFADGRVPDHPQLWGGDGRITVGHFALLRERFLADRLQALTLFDGVSEVGWSRRESAMAERILNAQGPAARTLVIAGNAHTALTPTMLGIPLGARLAEWRPGVREIHIRYGNGSYYNLSPQRFKHQFSLRRKARLKAEGSALVLDLPAPMQARVPHRMAANQPPAKPSPPGYTGAFPAYLDQPHLPPPQRPGRAGYPDYPQQPVIPVRRAAPTSAPTSAQWRQAPAGPPPGQAPADQRRGGRNPYETGLTPR
ncbi:MAG TPA: hypothetical protein VHZ33_33370 [Trebonia sp.]|nr:hypothetical protein [Trebonia sp.]